MIATVSVQSHRMAQSQDHRISLNANTAGAPLPTIPRRMSSSSKQSPFTSSLSLPSRKSLASPSLVCASSMTTITTITPATPPKNDSDSSSSSSSGSRPTIRTKRVRGVRNGSLCLPELSTLTAAPTSSASVAFPSSETPDDSSSKGHSAPSRPMLYTPGMSLRQLTKASRISRNVSESNVSYSTPVGTWAPGSASSSHSTSALSETFGEPKFIRKKSGQLVKPSLKPSRSTGLTVSTFGPSSKSEPATPINKAVHFDTKLEHVKLFLAEQKPLAVSRDGSPTDDTSGTDSDFPKFIFGEDEERLKKTSKLALVMQVANMPGRINPDADVTLEELVLSSTSDSILGKVRVRNIAYNKWIAVRFTFDSWQTTSEVTGKYMESLSPEFDRFTFTIRLNDLLARIEGKTLITAVRYSVEGREMWDNNGGQNYLATFTKSKLSTEELVQRPVKATTLSDDEASTDMADLRSKLEKVVQSRDRTGPAFLAQQSSARRPPASADPDITSFRSNNSFASRYDLGASLKNIWKSEQSHPVHTRTHSFPLSTSSSSPFLRGSSIPFPIRKSPSSDHPDSPSRFSPHQHLGSPRDIGEDGFPSTKHTSCQFHDVPFHVQQPRPGRNHQRGYFDLGITTTDSGFDVGSMGLRPETPSDRDFATSPQRYNSFPPMVSPVSTSSKNLTPALTVPATSTGASVSITSEPTFVLYNGDDSELSTPSMITPTSSGESTPSPMTSGTSPNWKGADATSPDSHYRHFLSKFCFFTGPGSVAPHDLHSINPSPLDISGLPRTQSASEIEELISGLRVSPIGTSSNSNSGLNGHGDGNGNVFSSTNPTEVGHGFGNGPVSPVRSPSLDDLMLNTSKSGSLTPTISRLSIAKHYGTVEYGQNATPVLV